MYMCVFLKLFKILKKITVKEKTLTNWICINYTSWNKKKSKDIIFGILSEIKGLNLHIEMAFLLWKVIQKMKNWEIQAVGCIS